MDKNVFEPVIEDFLNVQGGFSNEGAQQRLATVLSYQVQ